MDALLSSEVGLDSELAAKLSQGILVSLNGANVKDRLKVQQMQSKLGAPLPPIPDEVSSIKEQIAADQVATIRSCIANLMLYHVMLGLYCCRNG